MAPGTSRSSERGAEGRGTMPNSHGANLSTSPFASASDYPDAATTLVGMSTTKEVSRNLSAIDGGPPPEILQEIEAILAPVHNMVWISGRPEK